MKVYVLTYEMDYEGSMETSVFRTAEKAKERAAEREAEVGRPAHLVWQPGHDPEIWTAKVCEGESWLVVGHEVQG